LRASNLLCAGQITFTNVIWTKYQPELTFLSFLRQQGSICLIGLFCISEKVWIIQQKAEVYPTVCLTCVFAICVINLLSWSTWTLALCKSVLHLFETLHAVPHQFASYGCSRSEYFKGSIWSAANWQQLLVSSYFFGEIKCVDSNFRLKKIFTRNSVSKSLQPRLMSFQFVCLGFWRFCGFTFFSHYLHWKHLRKE